MSVPDLLLERLRPVLAARHRVSVLDGDPRDRSLLPPVAACDVVVQGYSEPSAPLTAIDEATRGTWNLLTTTRAARYVQLSSMRLFDTYAREWAVKEPWSPRPTTAPTDLAAYLAELTSLEVSRARQIDCVVLRLDRVVPATTFADGPVGPDWLHVDDAITAIARAVECPELPRPHSRWRPLHIVRGDRSSRYPLGAAAEAPFGFAAEHTDPREVSATADASFDPPPYPEAPGGLAGLAEPERVTVFGAGGPLASATVAHLNERHQLLLTDTRPLQHFAAAPPQSIGAPKPRPVSPPNREAIADITDLDAVLAVSRDADCLVNCAVVRTDPVLAFTVNVLGAYNTMRAAVQCGIRRVVHTGPALVLAPHPLGYQENRAIGPSAPPRPGADLYFLTKYLGQEICRIFAETHRIACPVLLYCGFVNPETAAENQPHPFSVSWDDAGRAMAAAVQVTALPEPCPVLHVLADSPHDRYRNDATRNILNWQPEEPLDHLWYRK